MNAEGESLQNLSTTGNGKQKNTEGGPSGTGEAENRGPGNSDVSKAIEKMEQRNKELEDKTAKIELRNRELGETVAETDVLFRLFLLATFKLDTCLFLIPIYD